MTGIFLAFQLLPNDTPVKVISFFSFSILLTAVSFFFQRYYYDIKSKRNLGNSLDFDNLNE